MASSTDSDPDLASERYISLTTYKSDGTPKPLPVWICGLPDGRIGFTTSIESWKAKRITANPKVKMQVCDQRGNVAPGAAEYAGSAVIVQGEEFIETQTLIKAKYGVWVTVVQAVLTVRGLFEKKEVQSNSAVIITLD